MKRTVNQLYIVDYSVCEDKNTLQKSTDQEINESIKIENVIETPKTLLNFREIGQKKFIEAILDTLSEKNSLTLTVGLQNKNSHFTINGAEIELTFEFYMKI